MVYTFDGANAPTRHTTQYFEMTANRGIYQDRLDCEYHAGSNALGDHWRRA